MELSLHPDAKFPPEDGGGHYFATIDLRKRCVIVSFPAVEAIIMSDKAFILKGGDGFVRLMHKTYYGPKAAGRIVTSLPWEELILECCLMRVCSNEKTLTKYNRTRIETHARIHRERHTHTHTHTRTHAHTRTHTHTPTNRQSDCYNLCLESEFRRMHRESTLSPQC